VSFWALLLLRGSIADTIHVELASALTLHAASGKFAPFFVFRVLLGLFESVVSPVLIALVASFYAKNEQSKRIGAFYAMSESFLIGPKIAFSPSKLLTLFFRRGNKHCWRSHRLRHYLLYRNCCLALEDHLLCPRRSRFRLWNSRHWMARKLSSNCQIPHGSGEAYRTRTRTSEPKRNHFAQVEESSSC